jgi:hypothetical protein
MLCCSVKKRKRQKMVLEPTYIEPTTGVVELVKYEKIIGDTSDTSCEQVTAPTPPPRISFLLCEQEDNSSTNITSTNNTNTSSSSKNSTSESDDDMFNVSVNHNILSRSFKRKEVDSPEKIEPLFTINISIKNERNGVLIHRKFVV